MNKGKRKREGFKETKRKYQKLHVGVAGRSTFAAEH